MRTCCGKLASGSQGMRIAVHHRDIGDVGVVLSLTALEEHQRSRFARSDVLEEMVRGADVRWRDAVEVGFIDQLPRPEGGVLVES